MPGPMLQTDALVLARRLPAESFQTLTVFCATHGVLTVLQRVPKKPSPRHLSLDLFDEASLRLETSATGGPWFVHEARLLVRLKGIGRDYETLRHASALATLVTRNPVAAESRPRVAALLREAFAAFAADASPAPVYFKSLWRFARDEGHPLRQQWLPSLSADLRAEAEHLLRTPLAELAAEKSSAAQAEALTRRLENYLAAHTEIRVD
ncbi:MAG: hypothetical protein WCL04_00675 [Verrucomicrobiota bacterium]